MSETLYRKYRPQTFADLVGQRHVRVTLEQAIQNNRVAHAYIFTGPRGVGKTTTARLISRAVNCLDRGTSPEPCNTCANCQAILQGRALDVMEIDAASQTGVDNVRENVIQSARAYPSMLRMKVFIIDEVHMLSLAAFNALLKLIEEPPAHAMFIMATTDVHRVPDTILSRTQRFDFQRVGLEDIEQRLQLIAKREGRRLATGVAERIARQASGSLRDAESLLGQLFSFADKEVTAELLDTVLPRSDQGIVLGVLETLVRDQAAESMRQFHSFIAEGGDVTAFIKDMLAVTRQALLLAVDRQAVNEVGRDQDAATLERLQALPATATPSKLVTILDAFATALRQIPLAMIEELPVEIAIVTICGTGPSSPTSPTEPRPVPTETSPTTPRPSRPAGGQKKFTLAAVESAWSAVQREGVLPPGLALSAKQAVVTGAADGVIELTVPFTLHADRLNAAKNAQLIREQLQPVLGDVSVHVAVDPARAATEPPARAAEAMSVVTPKVLQPQPVAVTTGDELWDTLVSSLGTDSTTA